MDKKIENLENLSAKAVVLTLDCGTMSSGKLPCESKENRVDHKGKTL